MCVKVGFSPWYHSALVSLVKGITLTSVKFRGHIIIYCARCKASGLKLSGCTNIFNCFGIFCALICWYVSVRERRRRKGVPSFILIRLLWHCFQINLRKLWSMCMIIRLVIISVGGVLSCLILPITIPASKNVFIFEAPSIFFPFCFSNEMLHSVCALQILKTVFRLSIQAFCSHDLVTLLM